MRVVVALAQLVEGRRALEVLQQAVHFSCGMASGELQKAWGFWGDEMATFGCC